MYCISIHAPREGGDSLVVLVHNLSYISIHAPREGGDQAQDKDLPRLVISIHAPREGGDPRSALFSSTILIFQSTPPARGATMPSLLF